MTENRLTDDLPGFDDPLALLRACHEKILTHCDLLEGLVAHMVEAGPWRNGVVFPWQTFKPFRHSGKREALIRNPWTGYRITATPFPA
jgi:hypothetical protein